MSSPNDQTRLIINYLPQDLTDKDLYNLFSTVGPIETSRVMRDNKTNYSYGFGFVTYTRPEDAATAIMRINGTEIQTKRLKVSYARPSTDDIKDTNLYISNLPKHYNETDLDNLFGKFGQIVQKNILKDKITGMPRGVAFVRYDRKDSAQQAIQQLDGFMPDDSDKRLNVKIAEEHGKKKAQYFAGFNAGAMQNRVPPFMSQTAPTPLSIRGRGPPNRANPNFIPYPNLSMGGRMIGGGVVRPDKSARRFNPMPGIW